MPYYHVYIEYLSKSGENAGLMNYNLGEEFLKEKIVTPFNRQKAFAPLGIIIQPSQISRICIFKSTKKYADLVLPDGKSPLGRDDARWIAWCFYNDKVEDVVPCTEDFISLLPAETTSEPLGDKKQVFIGHGRDLKEALELQKYLREDLKVEAKIFEDLKEERKRMQDNNRAA
jgi:hypothetical protein